MMIAIDRGNNCEIFSPSERSRDLDFYGATKHVADYRGLALTPPTYHTWPVPRCINK